LKSFHKSFPDVKFKGSKRICRTSTKNVESKKRYKIHVQNVGKEGSIDAVKCVQWDKNIGTKVIMNITKVIKGTYSL